MDILFDLPCTRAKVKKLVMANALLTQEEEQQLFENWKKHGCEKSYEKIVLAFSRVVYKYTNIATRGKETRNWIDIFQSGLEGVMLAIPRFDTSRGIRFSTFATFYVRWKIQDFLQRNSVILSGNLGARVRLLQKWYTKLKEEAEELAPTGEGVESYITRELNERFGFTPEEVDKYRILASSHSRISDPCGEDGTIGDLIKDDKALDEDDLIEKIDNDRLIGVMRIGMEEVLSEREREILVRRRMNPKSETLQDIGEDLGLSKERVRQIEATAIDKLRVYILQAQKSDIQRRAVERSAA